MILLAAEVISGFAGIRNRPQNYAPSFHKKPHAAMFLLY
jgi:hypothetical protein